MAKPQAIQPGYYVAVCLELGTAPHNCYIGLVEAADEYGVRITTAHWDNELDVIVRHTEDVFIPWESITSMLVCTKEQPAIRFIKDKALAWQADIESMRGAKKTSKADK